MFMKRLIIACISKAKARKTSQFSTVHHAQIKNGAIATNLLIIPNYTHAHICDKCITLLSIFYCFVLESISN